MKVHLCGASVHNFLHVLCVLGLCAFSCSCISCFSGLGGKKKQSDILTHKIYLGISHSDSTHINGLSYILSGPRISLKKHPRVTGGQKLLFILFHHPASPKTGKVSANINSNIEIVHISPRAAPLPSLDP